ncbi:MAG: hypothetical protein WAO11_05740, partial [Candidatus Acidiferrum sp.]
QDVEESAVSVHRRAIFHTLINTCVENLISQKYFFMSSAQLVPSILREILTPPHSDVTVASRIP